jgi:hypothetical protein
MINSLTDEITLIISNLITTNVLDIIKSTEGYTNVILLYK